MLAWSPNNGTVDGSIFFYGAVQDGMEGVYYYCGRYVPQTKIMRMLPCTTKYRFLCETP